MQENIPDSSFEDVPEPSKFNFPSFKFNKKTIISLIVFIVLLVSIPVTAYLVKQTQILKSRADEIKVVPQEQLKWQTYIEMSSKNEIKPPEEILEIQLNYDKNANPQISLGKIQRKNGYAPKYDQKNTKYKLVLYDNQDKEIYSLGFNISGVIMGPPPLKGEIMVKESRLVRTNLSATLTVPWFINAAKLTILDSAGSDLVVAPFKDIPKIENSPNFHSIKGENLVRDTILGNKKSGIQNVSPRQINNAAGDSNGYLDIAFIGDLYNGDFNKFHQDVERFSKALLTYEPFKSRAFQIRFYYIDNPEDLSCNYEGRLLTCNVNKAIDLVNNAEVPYDRIVIIANSDIYGGAGYLEPFNIAITYNGDYGGELVFVHEFGHSFGRLADEYIADYPLEDEPLNKNCLNGNPPDPDWQSMDNAMGYFQGCGLESWYRSGEHNIMRDYDRLTFDTVSRVLLNNKMDVFAGSFDGEVSLIDYPPTPTPSNTLSCFECKGSRPGVNAPTYFVESYESNCQAVCFNNLGNACVYQHPTTPSCQTKDAALTAQKVKDDAVFSGTSFNMQCAPVDMNNCLTITPSVGPIPTLFVTPTSIPTLAPIFTPTPSVK